MNKIICTTLLFTLMIQLSLTGQSIRCDNIIFPACPGTGGNGFTAPTNTEENRSPATNTCSYDILQEPLFGTLTISGFLSPDNNIDSIFFYQPSSNCFLEDNFTVLECCTIDTGETICDTVLYMIHLDFVCETPSDKFCCLSSDGQPIFLDVLANDEEFLATEYPNASISSVTIQDISELPDNGAIDIDQATGDLVYSPNPGFTGIDSITYEVFYDFNNGTRDITICGEQTAYLLVEDCVQTVPDNFTTFLNNTLCFNPLENDFIEPALNEFCPIETECQNPLPELALSSFSWLTDPNSFPPTLYDTGNGVWCFESPVEGTFSYTYQVCSTAGLCNSGLVTFNVSEFCPPFLQLEPGLIPDNLYQAGQFLFAQGFVPPGSEVRFKAGEIITLNNGFRVYPEARFSAEIESCGACWDFNLNGQCDEEEDMNGDGLCNEIDCPIQLQLNKYSNQD